MDARTTRRQQQAATARSRRRWGLAVGAVALAVGATAAGLAVDRDPRRDPGQGAGPAAQPAATPPAATPPVATTATVAPPPELPRGGRKLFPDYTVVGFYGMQNLDVLGAAPPDVVAQRLLKVARAYATPGHPVMPMF